MKKKTNKPKLTNEIVDSRLISNQRTVKRIGDIINSSTKLEWCCTVCDYRWYTTANSILNLKSGCSSCYGNVKYTNEDIDEKIKNRSIVRISQCDGMMVPITWECTQCLDQWNASPSNIINRNSGCPQCSLVISGKKKSIGQLPRIQSTMSDKKLVLLSPYTRVIDKHNVRCEICTYCWEVRLNDIMNNDNGCPQCSRRLPLTNEMIDTRLLENNRNIIRVGNVVNATTKIEWQCTYNHVWMAVPDSVINAGSGCPTCSNVGRPGLLYFKHNPHKKLCDGILYLVRGEHNNITFIKVGITTRNVIQRYHGFVKDYNIEEIVSKPMNFYEAYLREQEILQEYLADLYAPSVDFGGRTECIRYDEKIIQDIKSKYFD